MQQSVSQGLCHMTNILILASIYRPWKDYSALFKRPESVFIQSGLQLLPMAFSTRRVCIDHFHWRLSCFPPLFLSLSFQKSQKQSYNSSPKSGSDTLEEKRNEKKKNAGQPVSENLNRETVYYFFDKPRILDFKFLTGLPGHL